MRSIGERQVPEVGAAAPLRVVLADDDADFLLILRARLNLLPGLEIVGTAGDGAEALEVVARTAPDAVVVDLLMPVVDGYATLAELRRRHPDVGAVAFSAVATSSARERVAALGVELVLKTREVGTLAQAVHRSAAGGPGSAAGALPTAEAAPSAASAP